MSGHNHANSRWLVSTNSDGTVPVEHVKFALLQDIRDELQKLNALLHCSNFLNIPHKLDRIRIATARIPVRKKRKKVTP
jgi:hypothetical protein